MENTKLPVDNAALDAAYIENEQIGRASCRERV